MHLILIYTMILLAVDNYRAMASSSVAKSFKESQIVPDVITKAPRACIAVKYPSGVSVELGNELTPTQVKDVPSVSYEAEDHYFYTLAMVDPDVPSRAEPTQREYRHWLVGNIPGCEVCAGETLTAYIGSAPPPGAGLHRYVFLLYRQPGRLCFTEPRVNNTSVGDRPGFSISAFAKKYKLGDTIAGNFFLAEFDNYVPILDKQLGI